MPENMKDIAYLLFTIPILGIFAHIVALIALSPILYFFSSPDSKTRRWLALLGGTPVLWIIMFYGSYYTTQFFQTPSTMGLLLAACVSTALMLWGAGKKWFDRREWVGMVMLFGFPAVGYIVGLTLSY